MRKRLLIPALLAVLALALAQDAPAWANLDTRVSILETRANLFEADLLGLRAVPTQLAKIETQLDALTEKTGKTDNYIGTIVTSLITLVMGSVTGAAWQARKSSGTK